MKCICGHDKGWHFIDAMGCIGEDVCCWRDENDELSCNCHKYNKKKLKDKTEIGHIIDIN